MPISLSSGAAASASLALPAVPPPASADAHLVARFETALQGAPSAGAMSADAVPGTVNAAPDAANVVPSWNTAGVAPASGTHAGERILATLHAFSTGAGDAWNRMTQFATVAGEPTMAHLLQIEMGAMQASVQFDYFGKIISRSTQNIDQLIKTQ
ncbi:type III secretion system inner rod subunit SctI [Robbsia sp. Bb-Pol-6]|uniref:Type III secretion system inner rod subunit SctI n=1 Tax=Robbsia betulipollinis TaxID=2981849 RepID=A0ABT3ZL65_9BURK|nr:type III secretion system inner rod subunit SctI [Robbsia betulipollinis]MCY0387279.1 type III secretion system inner rod subunit SctI [Robbsia betulipollinis]